MMLSIVARLNEFVEFAEKTRKYADAGFYRDVIAHIEQAEARCVELEDACICVIQVAPPKGPLWHGSPHVQRVREALGKAPTGAWLLRKQADEIDIACNKLRRDGIRPESSRPTIAVADLHDYANRLRQQASEIESGDNNE